MFENLNFEPFKEPKGFLKVLQWIFAICAFATTCNFSTKIGFTVNCANGTSNNIHTEVQYPFTLDHHIIDTVLCNNTPTTIQFYGNEKSNSEFFVATGVLSFIYSTALIAIFLIADKVYAENPRAPVIDFFVTLVLAVFWLSGSAAWAHGHSGLVDAGNYNWNDEVICKTAKSCSNFLTGAFGGIVISYLFGFINFILWAANLWFLYKETTWFDGIIKNTGGLGGGGSSIPASSSGGI